MASVETEIEVRCALRALQELPPPPAGTRRLLDVLRDESVDLRDVAEAVEEVPPVAARLVGLAGSAYFGSRSPVRSVEDAIVRVLGLKFTRSVALGIALSGLFDARGCSAFDMGRYWGSALGTAAVARALSGRGGVQDIDAEAAYLCGLLHNLGLLALVHVAASEVDGALRQADGAPPPALAVAMRERLGTDHWAAGAWVARRWQLPPAVAWVMEHYHDADYCGEDWQMVVLVGESARWWRWRGASGDTVPCLDRLGMDAAAVARLIERAEPALDAVGELTRMMSAGP
ncbi:MAG: HDOD domain-containing protein [Ectothiorhodospiraceae bacterium]|nr:HDOD domain-containing protein [Chromatiales bacterium]MCP5153658.1 HDOD domain-containing protein [Ectothiorhodospiraceae bacterium]